MLSDKLNFDLVGQAWYGYGLSSTVLPALPITLSFNANGTWTCPAGVFTADFTAYGAGGSTTAAEVVNGPSAAGGGGAYASTAGFTTVPGTTYTIQCFAGGQGAPQGVPDNTWISNTGVAPTSNAEGVLANSGQNGPLAGAAAAGAGGAAAGCFGTVIFAGAAGGTAPGPYPPGTGGSGGGGGGAGSSAGAGAVGTIGVLGAQPGGAGGLIGGGRGGASDGSASLTGIQGTSGGGCGGAAVTAGGTLGAAQPSPAALATITYTPTSASVITVMESWDAAPGPGDPNYINVYAPTQIQLPPLSPRVMWELRKFAAKWCK